MTAKQLTDSILQLAIQGKLVPQDPNDEPASVILEKIREKKACLAKEKTIKMAALKESPISDDEILYDIPENWVWCRVNDLFLHASGKQQSSNNKKVGTLQKYITTSNLYWGRFVLDNLKEMYFSSEEIKTCSATKGDLLVCEGGAGYGRSAIWEYDYDICLQNHVHRLRPIIKEVCNYVYYLIYYLKETNQLASVGMAMPGLSANRLKSLVVPLPPLAEQRRIVERIEEFLPLIKEYGEAYDEASKMDAELPDKLKKSILQDAIKGKLGTQVDDDEPASVLLEQIREEKKRLVKKGVLKRKDLEETPVGEEQEPFKIPEKWEWARLGGISFMYTGNSISETEKSAKYTNVVGINYIGTKDVGFDHSIDYNNGIRIPLKYQDKFKKAPSGCVLMCIEGGSAGRKIGILNEEVCFGNKLCCFNPICVNNKYIYYYLQSPTLREIFKSNLNGIIGGVSISKLSPLIIPLPPLAEQHRIVEKIEALFAEIENMTINKNNNEIDTEETEV